MVWVQGSVLHHLVFYVHNGVQDSILQRLVFGMLKIHKLLISKNSKETFRCGKSDESAYPNHIVASNTACESSSILFS